jgi:hypothetical protein
MKQQRYGIRLLVASLAALALTGPARAEQISFEGTSSGVVKTMDIPFAVPGGPPVIPTQVDGSGQSTVLGPFKVAAVVIVDPGLTGVPPVAGSWTLTDANGDKLFLAMFGGQLTPDRPVGWAVLQITGGTGRFQGATGGYVQAITFSDFPGSKPSVTYTDVMEGAISLPGSKP